jgi:iron complex transport system ATP-binding protein
MMNAMEPALTVRDITFRYTPNDRPALDGVSTDVRAGAITAVLGPNGSGKSTLLHVLLGLLQPERGEVRLFGRPLGTRSRREASRLVGLVPQSEPVTFDLSVFEYALLGRAPYLGLLERPGAEDRACAERALETAGIAALSRRAVPSLSGGERQLATVARALAQEPRVLLLDEPTSHLDLANVRRILGVLRSLRADGRTIILTTHDPNAAAAIADDVLLLRQGHVMATGPVESVLQADHLSATYGVPVEVLTVRGRPLVLTHDLDGAPAHGARNPAVEEDGHGTDNRLGRVVASAGRGTRPPTHAGRRARR